MRDANLWHHSARVTVAAIVYGSRRISHCIFHRRRIIAACAYMLFSIFRKRNLGRLEENGHTPMLVPPDAVRHTFVFYCAVDDMHVVNMLCARGTLVSHLPGYLS